MEKARVAIRPELQFGHGLATVDNHTLGRIRPPGCRGFNWATAARRWLTPRGPWVARGSGSLPFGHGLSSVDNLSYAGSRQMPRETLLQFCHGLSTVDNWSPAGRTPPTPACFNSATASRPWITA